MTSSTNSDELRGEDSAQLLDEMLARDRQADLMLLHRDWQNSAVRRRWIARARHNPVQSPDFFEPLAAAVESK
jgi:hypothetical protein